jgi:hypothetical protein
MKILAAAMVTLSVVSLVSAEDLTTLSGKTYKNFRITRATTDGITVKHSSGVATVATVDLTDEQRAKFVPAPSTNAAMQPEPTLYHVRGKVITILKEGVVLDAGIMTLQNYRQLLYVEKTDPVYQQYVDGKMYMVGGAKPRPIEHNEKCLILGEGAGIADNDNWDGAVYYAGIHHGMVATVRCFSKSKDVALKRLEADKLKN